MGARGRFLYPDWALVSPFPHSKSEHIETTISVARLQAPMRGDDEAQFIIMLTLNNTPRAMDICHISRASLVASCT
ncbi:hypothetical protein ACNKHM_10950 [Shigella sonnei]